MRGVYLGITKNEYARMLKNRISALKTRIRRKNEERELKMLRTMARRLYLLHRFDLMPKREFELLKTENDHEFEILVNYMAAKEKQKSQSNSSGQE